MCETKFLFPTEPEYFFFIPTMKLMNLSYTVLSCMSFLAVASAAEESKSVPILPETTCFDFDWSFRYFGSMTPEDAAKGIFAPQGSQKGHPATDACDGDYQTRWCASNGKKGHSLVVLSDGKAPVKELRIHWEKKDAQKVEVDFFFPNGETEKQVVSMENGTSSIDAKGRAIEKLQLNFPEASERAWASVREIELVGTDGKLISPARIQDLDEPAMPGYDEKGFRAVQLPHDWAIESPFLRDEPNETGKLPWNGFGWYRKHFEVPAGFSAEKDRYYLDFDGVMSHPLVFVNGKKAGEWAYGYSSFRVDITPFLKPGKDNLVAVRASNKPLSTRWYPGAGIYRHVRLVRTSPTHIAYNGIYVTTPEISSDCATLRVATEVENTGETPSEVSVRQSVGKVTAPPVKLVLAPGESCTLEQHLSLPNPKLWSCEEPNLYHLTTTLSQKNAAPEVRTTRFGVRRIEWKPDGLHLNGKRVRLNGVCEHHDLGALGSAFHRKAWERKVAKLKEMGCNSIRTSHNPPAPEVLDVCDEQGILVLDELFDIWKEQKYDKVNGYHQDWEQWWKKDVKNFVCRDRNHPSVIMWSGGNEISEITSNLGVEICRNLRDEFRKYDTTRPFTVGVNNASGAWNGFGDVLDVMGFNYKPWSYREYVQKRPNKAVFGSETASGIGTRGFYLFPLRWEGGGGASAFQVSGYGVAAVAWGNCGDVEFKAQDDVPNVAGEYVWTGFDYLGEPTPYNQDASNVGNLQALTEAEKKAIMERLHAMGNKAPSRSSYFGLIDLAGFPKDAFYLYKSRWSPNERFAHLLPHWNWKGREGEVTPVMCFSSGDEAELFVNGKSQGVCRKDKLNKGEKIPQGVRDTSRTAYRFVWENVVYEPGEISVVVKKNGKPWAEDKVMTTGEGVAMQIALDGSTIVADGHDLSFIELVVVDEKGNVVPTDCRKVSFSIEGPAVLIGFCNGNPIDQTCMQTPQQEFFNGRILAVVRSKRGETGSATVTVRAENLPPVRARIKVVTPNKK